MAGARPEKLLHITYLDRHTREVVGTEVIESRWDADFGEWVYQAPPISLDPVDDDAPERVYTWEEPTDG